MFLWGFYGKLVLKAWRVVSCIGVGGEVHVASLMMRGVGAAVEKERDSRGSVLQGSK